MFVTVECLASTEVGPFPSFIGTESVIVHDFVESHHPLGGLVIFDALVMDQRTNVIMHPSMLSSAMARILTFFG